MRQIIISAGNFGGIEEVAAVEIENGQLTGKIFEASLHYEQGEFCFANILDSLFMFISDAELIVERSFLFDLDAQQYGLTEDCLRDHCHSMQYINDLFRPHFRHDGWGRRTNATGLCHHFNLSPIRKVYGDSALSDAMIMGVSYLIMTGTR